MIHPTPLVNVAHLSKTFKDFFYRQKVSALSDLTLTINRGEICAILGPNGAGKSTFLKLLLGQLFPSSGVIKLWGKNPNDLVVKSKLGYLPEQTSFWPHFTAIETLKMIGELHHLPRTVIATRSEELLNMFGLSHAADRLCSEYSHGMRKRLGLAIALLHDPDLLILDEPTAGMDPLGCREVKDLLLALNKRGKTIIITSHLLGDIQDICTQALLFYGGQLLVQGSLDDLLRKKDELLLTFELKTDAEKSQLLAEVQPFLSRYNGKVHVAKESLETFFMNTIEQAKNHIQTSGADAGSGVAAYLEVNEQPSEHLDHARIQSLTEPEDAFLEDVAEIDHKALDALSHSD